MPKYTIEHSMKNREGQKKRNYQEKQDPYFKLI